MKKPINILHIEDDRADVTMILHELRKYWPEINHCQVEHLKDLQEALRKKWDIILSDFNLPEFDGLTALRLVRENDLDTPFIVVSGRVEEEIAASMMRLGANDYVMKDNLNRLGPAILREVKAAELKALMQVPGSGITTKGEMRNGPLQAGRLKEPLAIQHTGASNQILATADSIRERHKAVVNILYAATLIRRHQEKILEKQHISEPQFNVLSILRRQSPAETPMTMIKNESSKTSDISRAVDRVVKAGLAHYAVDKKDKRIRNISITEKGLGVLAAMDKCADEMFLNDTLLSEEQSKQINLGLQPMLAIMREHT